MTRLEDRMNLARSNTIAAMSITAKKGWSPRETRRSELPDGSVAGAQSYATNASPKPASKRSLQILVRTAR